MLINLLSRLKKRWPGQCMFGCGLKTFGQESGQNTTINSNGNIGRGKNAILVQYLSSSHKNNTSGSQRSERALGKSPRLLSKLLIAALVQNLKHSLIFK